MTDDYYLELGIALQNARTQKGLTQNEVARILGYKSPQFISNAERGLCRLPLEAISRLVKLYEMDVEVVIRNFLKAHEAHYRKAFRSNIAQGSGRGPARSKGPRKL